MLCLTLLPLPMILGHRVCSLSTTDLGICFSYVHLWKGNFNLAPSSLLRFPPFASSIWKHIALWLQCDMLQIWLVKPSNTRINEFGSPNFCLRLFYALYYCVRTSLEIRSVVSGNWGKLEWLLSSSLCNSCIHCRYPLTSHESHVLQFFIF